MTVKEIVKQYLEQNGYDGLAGEGCGCLENDLFLCGADGSDCVAGHKIIYGDPDCEGDNCEWEGDCRSMLGTKLGYCVRAGKRNETK